MLKWARDNGCPWNINPSIKAAKTLSFGDGVLMWAKDSGAPCDEIYIRDILHIEIYI